MNTPIVDFVKKYSNGDFLRMHMPGHKGENVLGCENLDITEIDGADVLYSAGGIIYESQKNATTLFETKNTYYSAEGSSLCIRAMLNLVKLYSSQNGKKPFIAAARNAHKTFLTAAAFLNIEVDWLLPIDSKTLISCVITPDYLDEYLSALTEKPIAVYVTSPDYLGNITDIAALSTVCKKHGVLLLVDNAHGAYLKFLPNDIHPITLGADMCCDSAHKTLPVLTGGAYLHISRKAPDFFDLNAQRSLSLFASTSPSYLILQSLDMANKYINDGYREKLSRFVKAVDILKKDLTDGGYTLLGNESLKITIAAKSYGYTGYRLADIIAQKNIICEFCDSDYLVLMLTPEVKESGLLTLRNALLEIKPQSKINDCIPVPAPQKLQLPLNTVLYSPCEKKNICDCRGRVSASFDALCPPAIPIVLPGEVIDERAIERFNYYKIKEWYVVK